MIFSILCLLSSRRRFIIMLALTLIRIPITITITILVITIRAITLLCQTLGLRVLEPITTHRRICYERLVILVRWWGVESCWTWGWTTCRRITARRFSNNHKMELRITSMCDSTSCKEIRAWALDKRTNWRSRTWGNRASSKRDLSLTLATIMHWLTLSVSVIIVRART